MLIIKASFEEDLWESGGLSRWQTACLAYVRLSSIPGSFSQKDLDRARTVQIPAERRAGAETDKENRGADVVSGRKMVEREGLGIRGHGRLL